MPKAEFRRLDELRGLIADPSSPSAYFRNFETTIQDPLKKKHLLDLEMDLQRLDLRAWQYLKLKLRPLLYTKDEKRGWRALFDIFNGARAYRYLVSLQCNDIVFIPEAAGTKTPDLEGKLGSMRVLCEVKTISPSDDEVNARNHFGVRRISRQLGQGFFNKLTCDLQRAKDQMDAYCSDALCKKITYIVIDFDDIHHEYADDYRSQIDAYVATNPIPGQEVFFDIKGPFYAAGARETEQREPSTNQEAER
jgi:hypothetical protein